MKVILSLFVIIGYITCQQVISRNVKVQEMIDALKENEQLYDEVIKILDEKMKNDYAQCTNETKSFNCSDSEIWQQERAKSSKNITNLKDKIKKHNKTIDDLLQLNKQEVTKKNLTMVKLFPQIEKLKNDIELIENMLFLIEDTYLNVDVEGKSLLLLFDHSFGHPKAQQMQKSFIQLMNKRAKLLKQDAAPATDPAAAPAADPAAAPPAEGGAAPAAAEGEAPQTEEKVPAEGGDMPLIDEDIFDGEADVTEVEVSNLFQPTEEEEAADAQLIAEEIPDGVDVQEHDKEQMDKEIQAPQQSEEPEDLRIYEVREEFKTSIKEMGRIMHEQLSLVLEGLNNELDMRTQSVADLEKAILDLHHKHAKQIVQIYIETKKLQQTIFELDDEILNLDAQIFDCSNSDYKLKLCEIRKGLDQVVIDDLKTEKSFNAGSLNELEKLIEFKDKNVYEPAPMEPDPAVVAASEAESKKEAVKVEVQSRIQQRINSIKEEEKEVEQQLTDEQDRQAQLAQKHPELLASTLPEHLSQVPEIMMNAVKEIPIATKKLMQAKDKLIEKEEDSVLEQVEQELKAQELSISGENKLVYLRKNKSSR